MEKALLNLKTKTYIISKEQKYLLLEKKQVLRICVSVKPIFMIYNYCDLMNHTLC